MTDGTTDAANVGMRRLRLLLVVSVIAASPVARAAPPGDPLPGLAAAPAGASPGAEASAAAGPSDERTGEPETDARIRREEAPTRRSLVLSAAGTAGIYAALYGWLSLAWFVRTTDSERFQTHDEGWFGEDTYAGGADKLGHAWGNYAMTRGVSQILAYGGWSRRGSVAVAGALSLAFFTFSEIKDGYKIEYGFSYGDMIANATGVGLGVLMELVPELDRRFDFHVSYWPSGDYLARLEADGPFNTPEDYTGQTSLVSYHLGSSEAVLRRASWAEFVDLDVGFRAINYKPVPSDGGERSQELFVGVSINLQAVADSMTGHGVGAGMLHFVTEVYQAPYTTFRVFGVERTGSPPTSLTSATP